MAFQILFGDDEHTARDGPYNRLLKTRKWIYVSAALAILLAYDLYRPDAAADLLKVIGLPPLLIGPALMVGALYLLVQYGLLLGQLWVSYDLVLQERLTFRRAEELTKAQERVRMAREAAAKQSRATRDELRSDLAEVQRALSTAARELDERELDLKRLEGTYDNTASLKREQVTRRIELLKALTLQGQRRTADLEEQISEATFDVDVAEAPDVEEAEAELRHLRAQNPADRKGYKAMEVAVDVLRLIPPPIIGAWSLFRLGLWLGH